VIGIRRATDADRVAIARLHEASIRALGPSHYSPEEVSGWAAHIRPENYPLDQNFFVATVDGEVVGFGQYHGEEIEAVYVHPDYVGRGIGRMLLEKLESLARVAGAPHLFLHASFNAEAFYERCGFRRTMETTYRTRGGVVMRCALMEKEL
jgi:GNAT superfamily N-acetyltransferase